MQRHGKPEVQNIHWTGLVPASQSDALVNGTGSLATQLLAAQLHALHLGAVAAPAAAYPAPTYNDVPGMTRGAAMQTGAAAARSTSPGSVERHSPQLDPLLQASSDLLARLQLGAAGPMLAHCGPLLTAAIPHLQPHHLQNHHLQQHHSHHLQQQRRQPLPDKRRGAGGSTRQNEDKVRRTVYISDISDAVSEAQLASFFRDCGQLVDCRVCGDPNSAMRFAFIEFKAEESVQMALSRSGALLGDFPLRVSPSKTAIVPVNNTYLPRSGEEQELVARTVFVGNIDRVVEREQLRAFFGNLCGPVSKIRLLGDAQHNSKIAFVEFVTAESAKGALKLSGALLGTLPLRVSPSKTPVRVDQRRVQEQEAQAIMRAVSMAPVSPAGLMQLNSALLMAVAGLYPQS